MCDETLSGQARSTFDKEFQDFCAAEGFGSENDSDSDS